MNFLGVDLAWGSTAGTGLCLVQAGRAIASTRLRTDDEVIGWLQQYTTADCLVAVDAPVIVFNHTGRRRCDAMISHCFGAYHAGAHSANLGLAAFAAGVRAERLAKLLDLPVDPQLKRGLPTRRAIEVYPHPALVALFGLQRTLKYKAKSGRSAQSRNQAFEALIRLLEGLATAAPAMQVASSPRWAGLRQIATTSQSGAELDRIEDEIDAYICAYIGLYYWFYGLERCRIVGDVSDGYIVTPVTESLGRCLDLAATQVTRLVVTSKSDRTSEPPSPNLPSEPRSAALCACGCGAAVRSRYLPGHDAKHKSRLIHAARTGDQVARLELEALGWAHFIESTRSGLVGRRKAAAPADQALGR